MKATHDDAKLVLRTLTDAKHEAYLAGGCVRDILLELSPSDYDVTTSATPEEVQKLFTRTAPVGAAFGVVKVILGENRELDVATFRVDGPYSDNRRPDTVQYTRSAEEDVKRRDFTINGLLMTEEGTVIDYVKGKEDLKNRVIRAVGNPRERFTEDSLRVMRAIRFALKLDFRIEPNTWDEIEASVSTITNVSKERITEELTKMMSYGKCDQAWWLLQRSNLWGRWFGRIPYNPLNRMYALARVSEEDPFILPLAIISGNLTDLNVIANKLALTNKQCSGITSLFQHACLLTSFFSRVLADKRKFMYWDDKALVLRFIKYQQASGEYSWTPYGTPAETVFTEMARITALGWPAPLITGNDLIELGFTPHAVFSDMLEAVRVEQLEDRLLDKANVKAFLLAKFPAAPRKLDNGELYNGMSRKRMIATCKKCKRSMSFSVEFDTEAKPRWNTIRDGININNLKSGNIYFTCGDCWKVIRRTTFVKVIES